MHVQVCFCVAALGRCSELLRSCLFAGVSPLGEAIPIAFVRRHVEHVRSAELVEITLKLHSCRQRQMPKEAAGSSDEAEKDQSDIEDIDVHAAKDVMDIGK